MHANVNMRIMYADIQDTKTRAASFKGKKYFGIGVPVICLDLSHLYENVYH